MRRWPTLVVGALVIAITGCATTAPSMAPPSVDVRGKWTGKWVFDHPGAGGGDVTLELQQTGADVSGNATVVSTTTNPRSSYFEGVVTGNSLILKPPYASGTLTVQGDEMTGVVSGIMPATVTLRRQR